MLFRSPAVANIDQALLVFAVSEPKPNLNLLDRFLVSMGVQNIPVTICFNKKDLGSGQDLADIGGIYRDCGFPVLFTSAAKGEGMEALSPLLAGKTSAVAGPSGVGKSSIVNSLQQNVQMETGDVSRKIGRGKHTTRHSQLIPMGEIGRAHV